MLDRASIQKLAEAPERNDPMLNVALAEEGPGEVLLQLAACRALGAEALDVIGMRVSRGDRELYPSDQAEQEDAAADFVESLDRRLIVHPNAPDAVRDAVLARHPDDPFFLLAAATHARATMLALERCASVASESPLHDRPWLALFHPAACGPSVIENWAREGELLREAAAMVARDSQILALLAKDPARRVRRAVASNAAAVALLDEIARDAAPEVRARAATLPAVRERVAASGSLPGEGHHAVGSPAFDAALQSMQAGGALAHDAVRAILNAGAELDEEGAMLAAKHFDKDGLLALVNMVTATEHDAESPRGIGVGAGLALRGPAAEEGLSKEEKSLTTHLVHLVTRQPTSATRLTGKARVAWWMAESLSRCSLLGEEGLYQEARLGSMAYDRMIFARFAARRGSASVACVQPTEEGIPLSVIELAWRDPSVGDEQAVALAACAGAAQHKDRELPEEELDLVPSCRPLPVLERAVLAAIARTPVSPRAALAAIALEPRRVRYVLSAMPTWRGVLSGARLARVLRAHAGALSAAAPSSSGAHPPGVARWTDRRLVEVEAAIAMAVGDLTTVELLRRLAKGLVSLTDGVALAAAVEARAAIDGAAIFAPLLTHAALYRTTDAAALALWMLLEALDRPRPGSLIASAIDGLSGARSVVPPGVCEALATLERRSPGRLESVFPQSPRGRATVASAIARAYRAVGGLRDDA